MTLRKRLTSGLKLAGLVLGMGLTLTACSDSDSESITPSTPTAPSGTPTTDQLGVTYTGKTLLLGDNRTGLDGAVAARIKNPVSAPSADLQAVIFTKGASYVFDMPAVKLLAQAYGNNATIVVTDPDELAQSSFADSLKKAAIELSDQGLIDEAEVANDFVERVIKLRGKKLRTIKEDEDGLNAFRLQSAYTSSSVTSDLNSGSSEGLIVENGDTTSVKLPVEKQEPTAYNFGVSADNLFSWMIDGDKHDGGNDVPGLKTFTTYKTMPPSTVFGKVMNYKVDYKILSVYDIDTEQDIYFIQASPTFYSSQLGSSPDSIRWRTENLYLKNDKIVGPTYVNVDGDTIGAWKGPYFKSFIYRIAHDDDWRMNFTNCSPEVVTTFDEPYTVSLSLDAQNTYGAEPSVDTLETFPVSHSMSEEMPAKSAVVFSFRKTDNDYNWWTVVDIDGVVKDNKEPNWPLYKDWTPTMACLFKKMYPKGQYQLYTTMETCVTEACPTDDVEILTRDTCKVTIDLPEPVRVRATYKIEMTGHGDSTIDENAWISNADSLLKNDYGISLKRGNFYSFDKTADKCLDRAVTAFRRYVFKFRNLVNEKTEGTHEYHFVLKDNSGNIVKTAHVNGAQVTIE